MIITDKLFGPDYRIKRDRYQYIVQKRSISDKGKESWNSLKYPTTLGGAVDTIVKEQMLGEHEELTLGKYVRLYESSMTAILNALNY